MPEPEKTAEEDPALFLRKVDRIDGICLRLTVGVQAAAASRSRVNPRAAGLTTPDKPVARRPSTVPVQGRSGNGGTSERGASLRTDRRYCACCSLFPLPHVTVPPSYSLSRSSSLPPLSVSLSFFALHPCSSTYSDEPSLEIVPLAMPKRTNDIVVVVVRQKRHTERRPADFQPRSDDVRESLSFSLDPLGS